MTIIPTYQSKTPEYRQPFHWCARPGPLSPPVKQKNVKVHKNHNKKKKTCGTTHERDIIPL